MTKGELRKARKLARSESRPLAGELRVTDDNPSEEFSDTPRGHRALDRWAQRFCDSVGPMSSDDY